MRTNPELAKRFVEALSAENIDRQCKHEIRHGRPHLTEAEVEIMFQAYKKNGNFPAHDLAHAMQILGSKLALEQKDQRAAWADTPLALHATAREERHRTLWLIGIAPAKSLSQPRVPKEGEVAQQWARARRQHAALMAANPLPTPTAGSQPHTYPGVAELVMAHTLMAVAGDDAEMRLWASDIEWGARSLIRLHLGWEDDGVAN
jgi:hypothetical protein